MVQAVAIDILRLVVLLAAAFVSAARHFGMSTMMLFCSVQLRVVTHWRGGGLEISRTSGLKPRVSPTWLWHLPVLSHTDDREHAASRQPHTTPHRACERAGGGELFTPGDWLCLSLKAWPWRWDLADLAYTAITGPR